MVTVRWVLAWVVALALSAGVAPPAQAATTQVPTSFVTMFSEQGDPVAGGASKLWRPGAGTITLSRDPSAGSVRVDVSGGASDPTYTLEFTAAEGRALYEGVYTNAQSAAVRQPDFPGLDVSVDGRPGCQASRGRFEVMLMTADLSSVWIVYQRECETLGTSVFGEIRYGVPGDPDVLVAPDHLRWPAEELGTSGRPVPVTVVNTGSEPLTVERAAVTSGASSFDVVRNTCRDVVVAPGGECTVYVGFTPLNAYTNYGYLTIRDSSAWGSHRVALEGVGYERVTRWDMQSQPGDYVGQGSDRSYTPQDGPIIAWGTESEVFVAYYGDRTTWYAEFRADPEHLLLPGTTFYAGPELDHANRASLSVDGEGRSCGAAERGRFTVEEAKYSGGRLTRFAVTFEQHCAAGSSPGLYGAIAWRASAMPDVPIDEVPVRPVTDLAGHPEFASVLLGWRNPTANMWADTVVRVREGVTPPRAPDRGRAVYEGRASAVLHNGLTPSTNYSYAVFARDREGAFSEASTVTFRGTNLFLTAQRRVARDERIRLRGRLTRPSGTPLEDRTVLVYSRSGSSDSWGVLRGVRTDDEGRFRVSRLRGYRTAEYRAVAAPRRHWFGSTAGPVRVVVTR